MDSNADTYVAQTSHLTIVVACMAHLRRSSSLRRRILKLPDYYTYGAQCHRTELTSEQRSLPLRFTIDPGLVHHRLIQTVIGTAGCTLIDEQARRLPPMPDWQMRVRLDHIYASVLLEFCKATQVPTLGRYLTARNGAIICSTEPLAGCRDLYRSKDARVLSRWAPYAKSDYVCEFEYSTARVVSDTLRSELSRGAELSVVAILARAEGTHLVWKPLVIGNPWLMCDDERWADHAIWWGRNFFEHFLEDFDEFSRVRNVPIPRDSEPMRKVSERGFKRALASILGGTVPADWGGETSDFVSTNLHLVGRRVSGAFLLKGPASFRPMGLNHLGKNNDQIVRLAQEPADVLFVQHSHEITAPVRATLRAFAVQPSAPRRYCLIDGRDSLRLLQAYGLFEQAVLWSGTK